MRVRDLVHKVDPYAGVDLANFVFDEQGWNSTHPIFRGLIEEIRPGHILEIGTWKGASALHMVDILKDVGLSNTEICCVDTWLGSLIEVDLNAAREDDLLKVNGYPTLYWIFLKNIIAKNAQDFITPIPSTATIAAKFFQKKKLSFDLIYIDGSHEYEDTVSDIRNCWPLLSPKGVMFGDDFVWWPGVNAAVREMSATLPADISVIDEKWVLRRKNG